MYVLSEEYELRALLQVNSSTRHVVAIPMINSAKFDNNVILMIAAIKLLMVFQQRTPEREDNSKLNSTIDTDKHYTLPVIIGAYPFSQISSTSQNTPLWAMKFRMIYNHSWANKVLNRKSTRRIFMPHREALKNRKYYYGGRRYKKCSLEVTKKRGRKTCLTPANQNRQNARSRDTNLYIKQYSA